MLFKSLQNLGIIDLIVYMSGPQLKAESMDGLAVLIGIQILGVAARDVGIPLSVSRQTITEIQYITHKVMA